MGIAGQLPMVMNLAAPTQDTRGVLKATGLRNIGMKHIGTPWLTARQGGANNYGRAVEVAGDGDGRTNPVKHGAMGRLANELARLMPDARTVYTEDDGRDEILAMFLADREGDICPQSGRASLP